MKLFLQWFISTIAILIAAYLVPGTLVTVKGAIVLAVVLGLLNLLVKPFIWILTLPINVLTLGLFSFVINALLVMLAAYIVPGFAIAGFWSALLFSLVLTLIHWIFNAWSNS